MIVRFARPSATWTLAALLFVLAGASSCSKEKILVDPADGLEGVPSASTLTVWPETGLTISTYRDTCRVVLSACEGIGIFGTEDIFESDEVVFGSAPGTVRGMIVDVTDADQFELFRSASGGFQPAKDHALAPSRRYLQSSTDLFLFSDARPPGTVRYVARGMRGGVVTQNSPKTNIATTGPSTVAGNLVYTAPTGIPPDFRPAPDSLLFMSWDPYPGAAGYWVHVYQFTDQNEDEILMSGVAAPIYYSVTRDNLLAYFPASVTSYRIRDPLPPGALVLKQRLDTQGEPALLSNQVYSVRVAAVNASGQVIAYNGDTGSKLIRRREAGGVIRYLVSNLGATLVNTKRPVAPLSGTRIERIPVGTNSWIYPAATLRR